ncbi:MAG: hypothetical protein A2147_05545, partial [Chloroflexi bacterium RBG_16_57_8]
MVPILDEVFNDIGRASPTVVYVGAANGDNPEFFERMDGMIRKGRQCRILHAVLSPGNADVKKAVDLIESADAVFVSGGDVEVGMQVLKEKGVTAVLPRLHEQGRLFFGVSAGSIMLAKEWVRWRDPDDDSTAELFPCLGLAPLICDTHGEGDDWEELKAAVGLSPDGTPGYGITSGACLKVYPDGRLQAVAGHIYRYVRHGKTVTRQADVVPM